MSSQDVARAKASWEEHQTRQEVVALIDRLLDQAASPRYSRIIMLHNVMHRSLT